MLLPPLQWLPALTASMGRALGCGVSYQLKPTVSPLVYTVEFVFSEPQSGKVRGQLWNLVQMYAAKNDAVLQGVDTKDPLKLSVSIGIKRRFGPARQADPSA